MITARRSEPCYLAYQEYLVRLFPLNRTIYTTCRVVASDILASCANAGHFSVRQQCMDIPVQGAIARFHNTEYSELSEKRTRGPHVSFRKRERRRESIGDEAGHTIVARMTLNHARRDGKEEIIVYLAMERCSLIQINVQ